jgi:hypothetical protein
MMMQIKCIIVCKLHDVTHILVIFVMNAKKLVNCKIEAFRLNFQKQKEETKPGQVLDHT